MGEFGQGLIQLFYCTNEDPLCEVDCEAFFPFARSVIVRLIQKKGPPPVVVVPVIKNVFPPKVITGWNEVSSFKPEPVFSTIESDLDD